MLPLLLNQDTSKIMLCYKAQITGSKCLTVFRRASMNFMCDRRRQQLAQVWNTVDVEENKSRAPDTIRSIFHTKSLEEDYD